MFDFDRSETKKPNAFLTLLKVFGITFKSSIVSVGVAVVVFLLRFFRTMGKAKTILGSKQFKRNAQAVPLGTIRQTALNVGAINGEQMMS